MPNPSYGKTLTDGTTAFAADVMSNFQDILNGVTDGTSDLTYRNAVINGTASITGILTLASQLTTTGTTLPLGVAVTAITGTKVKNLIKCWATISESAGNYTIDDSYGVTSLTDNGVGDITVTWSTAFSSTSFCSGGQVRSANVRGWVITNPSTTTSRINIFVPSTNALIDTSFMIWAWGTQ